MRLYGTIVSLGAVNPGAGAEWSLTIPVGHFYTFLSLNAVFVTSAVAGNRSPRLQIMDGGGNLVGVWGCGFTQIASQTLNYTAPSVFMGQTDPNGTFGSISWPLPALLCLPGGFSVSSLTSGISGADQWSAINGVWEDNAS